MKVTIAFCFALATMFATPVSAAILAPHLDTTAGSVVLVSGGCGPYAHRGPFGGCRPNGPYGYYRGGRCPPGYHLGPNGRLCWPN